VAGVLQNSPLPGGHQETLLTKQDFQSLSNT